MKTACLRLGRSRINLTRTTQKAAKKKMIKIILNTVNSIIEYKLKETADKTGYTKETVYKAIFDCIRDYYLMCRTAAVREQAAIWDGQHDDFKYTYDKDYLKGDNFY